MPLRPIDSCHVTVLVDNVMDLLSSTPDNVTPHAHNVVKAGATEVKGTCLCCAHWGLSLVVNTQRGDTTHSVLFDSGPEGATVERNGDRLGVDFGAIEAVVLSHGHWDHVGGMTRALELISSANGGTPVPVHVNDDMFVDRGMMMGPEKLLPFEAVPSKQTLTDAGGQVVCDDSAQLILDDTVYISGEIPRVTPYEVGMPPSHVQKTADGWQPDRLIRDERYMAVHVKDKGIIVFTACSHAGVVNVLKDAARVFDPVPLYGVMGGFHLSGETMEKIIPDTVADLKQFDLKEIIPGHCTGWRAVHKMVDVFGEATVIPSAVGQSHSF